MIWACNIQSPLFPTGVGRDNSLPCKPCVQKLVIQTIRLNRFPKKFSRYLTLTEIKKKL